MTHVEILSWRSGQRLRLTLWACVADKQEAVAAAGLHGTGSFAAIYRTAGPALQQHPHHMGPYVLQTPIGRGGMGTVYRATDTRLGREVAVKVLHRDLPMAGARERFLQEARIASCLHHPNICTIHDLGEQDEDLYLVMELLCGEPVKERVLHGPCPEQEIRAVALGVARALAEAHAHGIVHRDIKPANLVVSGEGESLGVKVLDFGLAKRDGPRDRRQTLSYTRHGATVGTVEYMSPEQACGEQVDARSDLFSLGAVLYEMATGAPPFQGATSGIVYAGLLNSDPVPPRDANLDLSADLDALIRSLLVKDRTHRVQTAAAVIEALTAGLGRTHESLGVGRRSKKGSGERVVNRYQPPADIPDFSFREPVAPEHSSEKNVETEARRLRKKLRLSHPGAWKVLGGSSRLLHKGRTRTLALLFFVLVTSIELACIYRKASSQPFTGALQVLPLENHTGNASLDETPAKALRESLEQSGFDTVRLSKDEHGTGFPGASTAAGVAIVTGYIARVNTGLLVHVDVRSAASKQSLAAEEETAPSFEQVPQAISRIAAAVRQDMRGRPEDLEANASHR